MNTTMQAHPSRNTHRKPFATHRPGFCSALLRRGGLLAIATVVGLGCLLGGGPVIASSPVEVREAWARATPPGARTGAVYLTLVSTGNAAALVAAKTPVAERAELHTHIHADGMMRMEQVSEITVPAGGKAELAPRGDHIMLFGLHGPLVAGEAIALTLEFASGERMDMQVPVRDGRKR